MWNLLCAAAAALLVLRVLGYALHRTVGGFIDVLLVLGGHCGALPRARAAPDRVTSRAKIDAPDGRSYPASTPATTLSTRRAPRSGPSLPAMRRRACR